MVSKLIVLFFWSILNFGLSDFVDLLDIDIDISEFRNADHDSGHFHEDDLLRFFLPDGTIICEGNLHGAVDSKIPCSFDKKVLKTGLNDIYHAVFTKEADGEWVELENSRDIMTLDLPDTAAKKRLTSKHIIAASVSAAIVGSGTKYFIDLRTPKPIPLPAEEIAFEEEEVELEPIVIPFQEEIFPVEETFPVLPPALPKSSPFLSTMRGRATIGAFFGLALGAGSIAANRKEMHPMYIPQSPVENLNWEVVEEVEEVVPVDSKPDLLTRIKKNAGTIALFIAAQGFLILRRRQPRLYNQHFGAYEIWSELIRR